MEDDLNPEDKRKMDTVTATQQLLEDIILSMLKLSITVNYIKSNRFNSLNNNDKEVLLEAFNRYRNAFTRHVYGTFSSMSDELKNELKGKKYQPTPFSRTDSYNKVESPQPLLELIQNLERDDGQAFKDIKNKGEMSTEWNNIADIGIFFGQISKEYCSETKLTLYTYTKDKNAPDPPATAPKIGLFPKENAYKYTIDKYVKYVEEGGETNISASSSDVMAANVLQRLLQAVQYFYAANEHGATAQIYKVESILHQDVERIPSDVSIPTEGIGKIISQLIALWSIVACKRVPSPGDDSDDPELVERVPPILFTKTKLVQLINLERGLYCMILCIELLRGFSNNVSGASAFKDGVQCS